MKRMNVIKILIKSDVIIGILGWCTQCSTNSFQQA